MYGYGRGGNVEILAETLRILEAGGYSLGDRWVPLKLSDEARRESVYYSADRVDALGAEPRTAGEAAPGGCRYEVTGEDSFAAARRLAAEEPGERVLVLNFANSVHPGGGVRHGARAQEEDLCRKSSLLLSLEDRKALPYYEGHRGLPHGLATDAILLSPEVEIIRGDDNELLEEPVVVSVLTCAAPDLGMGRYGLTREEIGDLFYRRILGILRVAAREGYGALVLGAWGCGAFGNDPEQVSDMFSAALRDFGAKDVFRRVAFAVLGRSERGRNYRAFVRNFQRSDGAEAVRDRVRGSLFGGAVGDALGYPVEFLGWDAIQTRYGPGGIQEYTLDRSRGAAVISDDTQMSLFTACGVLRGKTEMGEPGKTAGLSRYVYRAYLDWLGTQLKRADGGKAASWILARKELHALRAPGNTCLSALTSGQMGSVADHINNSKGCGGVMRVAPLALAFGELSDDLRGLDAEGAELAAITHGHPLGYIPAAFLTHVVHRAVFRQDEGLTLEDVVEEALDAAGGLFDGGKERKEMDAFRRLIRRAVDYASNKRPDAENIHALGGGWVGDEAVAIAVYCALRYPNDFTKCMIAAVNHSGDSDSTGAVAGNILGGWLGYSQIEARWKADLELSDLLLELSDDLWRSGRETPADADWLKKYGQPG